MKRVFHTVALLLVIATAPVRAEDAGLAPGPDFLAGADGNSSGQPSQRPVIGLKRKADFVVAQVSFSSDSRDAVLRTQEIHAMLLAALDKASGMGVELATGGPVLAPVTRSSYRSLPMQWAGREDTSKVDVLVKVPLTSTAAEADKRVDAFVRDLPRPGRGAIVRATHRMLAVRNPEQHRATIVKMIADEVRASTGMFGPEYRGSIEGIDKPVLWLPAGEAEVFLYLPYSYRVVAR